MDRSTKKKRAAVAKRREKEHINATQKELYIVNIRQAVSEMKKRHQRRITQQMTRESALLHSIGPVYYWSRLTHV